MDSSGDIIKKTELENKYEDLLNEEAELIIEHMELKVDFKEKENKLIKLSNATMRFEIDVMDQKIKLKEDSLRQNGQEEKAGAPEKKSDKKISECQRIEKVFDEIKSTKKKDFEKFYKIMQGLQHHS